MLGSLHAKAALPRPPAPGDSHHVARGDGMAGHSPEAFSVTLLSPPRSEWAQVSLSGDVDPAAVAELAAVIDTVSAATVSSVLVDVADVTFADSTLLNFCVLLRAVLPAGRALAVCRPAPMTRWIIEEAGLDRILTLRDDLPLLDVSRTSTPACRNWWSSRFGTRKGPGSSAS